MRLYELKASGSYMAVLPSPSTLVLLQAWSKEHGIKLAKDLHVTLLYSRTVVNVSLSRDEFVATGDAYAVMDGSLVLKLRCPAIEARHKALIAQGGTHDYPKFTPHLTLQKQTKLKPADVPMIDFGLIFGGEYIEPLKA